MIQISIYIYIVSLLQCVLVVTSCPASLVDYCGDTVVCACVCGDGRRGGSVLSQTTQTI